MILIHYAKDHVAWTQFFELMPKGPLEIVSVSRIIDFFTVEIVQDYCKLGHVSVAIEY
jgi:hypothetical protein